MVPMANMDTNDDLVEMENGKDDVSRRDFIASAGLTGAGALTGLSFFLSKDPKPRPARGTDESAKVRMGFIGVGSRGGALLRATLKVPGSEVVAVADVNPEAIAAAKENIQKAQGKGVEIFETMDYLELLKRPDVEAVVIATPHFMHGPMGMDALEAGKHVYLEKAMAFTIGECMDLRRMVKEREQKQVFQVGHQRHYSKIYRKIRDMVQLGQIGNVTAIRAQWNRNDAVIRPSPDPKLERLVNWRLYNEYSGGLMTEFASHQIDVANMVLAKPPAEGEGHTVIYPHSVCGMGGLDYPRYKRQKGRDSTDNVHTIFTYYVPFRERRRKPDGTTEWVWTDEKYAVRFTYMSLMTNELLGPSEIILGDEGSIEVSLAGGDFWKEAKALANADNVKEGTNPKSKHQKAILKTGATIAAVKKGIRPPDMEIMTEKDRTDWTEFVGKMAGGHSPQETMLAIDDYLQCIRKARDGQSYHVSANVDVGMAGAVAAIMGNMAMREERTVYWKEFGLPNPS